MVDPRQSKVTTEGVAHEGIKASRAIWVRDKIFSVGFSKLSEREYGIWDPKDLSKPLARSSIDSASGSIMPFSLIEIRVFFFLQEKEMETLDCMKLWTMLHTFII